MQRKFGAGRNGDFISDLCDANFGELYDAIYSVGKKYYLDPTNGNVGATGLMGDPVKTLAEGYALLRDGYNDVLFYVAGPTSLTIASGFDWAKSYAHFIGVCAPVPFSPRSRIFLDAAATGKTFLFKVSGSGCVISNLLIHMGVADTTAAYAGMVTGARNYLRGVHFAGIGNAAMDVAGAGSLLVNGGEENLFEDCVIGLNTVARGANSRELAFDGASSRNTFRRCKIDSYISAAGHALVKIVDSLGIDRELSFEDCEFNADSLNRAVALTSVFDIPAGIAQGMILLDSKCRVNSWGTAPSWDSNSRGILCAGMVAPAATAGGGIATHK
jgi:hypothetical protein